MKLKDYHLNLALVLQAMPFTFKSTSKQWKTIFHAAVFSREPIHCNTSTNKLQFSSILTREPNLVNSRLPKIKQVIIDYFKKDQTNMFRSYKKTEFLFHF